MVGGMVQAGTGSCPRQLIDSNRILRDYVCRKAIFIFGSAGRSCFHNSVDAVPAVLRQIPPLPPTMKNIARLTVSVLVACAAQLCAQTSLNFNLGGPAGQEIHQDTFIFASGGITATATAWSVNRSTPSNGFEAGKVIQWSPGIGVKNSTETITDTPYVPYYIDNQDHYDFVLFVFSEKVEIFSVKVHPSAGTFDLDASFWLGNVDPGITLGGDTFSDLASLGFGSRINSDSVSSNSPRDVGVTTPTGGVNALLFGSRVNGDAEFDRFKISNLHGTTVIPEPSTAGLLALTLSFGLGRRRR